jgi:Spy/CpxP family protein refolding chaperone
MHKKFFLVTAIVLAAAAGLSAAVMQVAGNPGHQSRTDKKLERMTERLDLTNTQQSQIRAILAAERAKVQPLRQQLRQNRLAQTANTGATFDEAQVRAFAAKQAQIMSNLTVERERAKSQIFAVLTPEQREKAQTLIQQHRGRRMHKPSQAPASPTPG